MASVFQQLFSVGGFGARHDDDMTDRMVSRYSTTIFIALCVVVTSAQYVGSPISCWCPAQLTGSQTDYTNAICLISPTYHVPFENDIPKDHSPQKVHINYYVWVPFILLCQALLCLLPSIVWKSLYKGVGFNIPSVIERLESAQNVGWEKRESAVKYVVSHIQRYTEGYFGTYCKGKHSNWFCCGKHSGNYLTFCYVMVKFLYVLVCVGQFMLLNIFLGMDFHFLGLDMIFRFIRGDDWTQMERFPRVTLCDFQVRHMIRVHKYIVQCALPINLFNEKIFVFIWFWLLITSLATSISFIKWLYKSLFWHPQIDNVRHYLHFMKAERTKDMKAQTIDFTKKQMRRDALCVIRLLRHNVGSMTAGEVLKGLWDEYYGVLPATQVPSCPPAAENVPGLKEVIPHVALMT